MNMKGLYVTANDLNKLSSSDMLVQIKNNFAITIIKRSGGEMSFPPMGQMILSINNFEIKSRTQAIKDVTQVKYRKLAANRKSYIFYYLLSAV